MDAGLHDSVSTGILCNKYLAKLHTLINRINSHGSAGTFSEFL